MSDSSSADRADHKAAVKRMELLCWKAFWTQRLKNSNTGAHTSIQQSGQRQEKKLSLALTLLGSFSGNNTSATGNLQYLPCLFFTKWDCCHYDKTRAIYLKFPFLERYQQFIKYKIFLVTTCALQNNSSHNLLINSNKFSTGGNLAQLDRIDLTIPIFDN